MQFSEEKKAPLDRVGRKVKKKKFFFFLGSGPKIGSVGTWETDNQIDVPLPDNTQESRDTTGYMVTSLWGVFWDGAFD